MMPLLLLCVCVCVCGGGAGLLLVGACGTVCVSWKGFQQKQKHTDTINLYWKGLCQCEYKFFTLTQFFILTQFFTLTQSTCTEKEYKFVEYKVYWCCNPKIIGLFCKRALWKRRYFVFADVVFHERETQVLWNTTSANTKYRLFYRALLQKRPIISGIQHQ